MIVAAMNQAFDSVNMEPPGREAVLGIVGLSLPEAITKLTQGGSEETVMAISKNYSQAFGTLRQNPDLEEPMYEGARDAIIQLVENDGFLLGIATGKSRRGVDRMLERFELAPYFVTFQTADVAPSKPHPGMIERALSETGASPCDTVMIGDTTFDMEMARNARVKGLGVSWGYHPVSLLEQAGVHAIADDYAQLLHMLEDMFAAKRAAG
ncbi:MAG: HAD-IA family hydrolase [Hyphomicrobiaceae bacterium]|nr:HAD-IA family hydrolase [Hyphomicrobiaceae bacterium]